MSIRELYRWPHGVCVLLIGQRGVGEDAELFRGVEYAEECAEEGLCEECEAGLPCTAVQRPFGGWIPLEGSAEEDLALEILRLKEAYDLQEQRHQGECEVLRKEAKYWRDRAAAGQEHAFAQGPVSKADYEKARAAAIHLREREALEARNRERELVIVELEQQRDSLTEQAANLLRRTERLEAEKRELAAALEELQDKPKKRSEPTEKAELPMSLLLSQEFKDAWTEYLQVRRERRWTTSKPWAERALRRLAQYPADVAARAVKESADQGYQGIFPEKALDAAQRELERHAPRGDQPTPPYLSRRGGA